MVREMSLMYPSFPLPVSLLGLRYLEAFFGMLIAVMCGMFGWMVRAREGEEREEGGRERGWEREEGGTVGERRGREGEKKEDGGREKRKGGRGRYIRLFLFTLVCIFST